MKHLTGRNCDDPKCGGKLRDTIINFGESLPDGKCFTIRFAKRDIILHAVQFTTLMKCVTLIYF